MVLLSVDGVSKNFGDKAVLREVQFELRSGNHVALVGPNGAGKTTLLKMTLLKMTLLKILTGEVPANAANAGEVLFPSGATVGYLQQHPEFAECDTVWNVAVTAVGDVATLAHQAEQVAHELAKAPIGPEHDNLLKQLDRLQVKVHQHDAYNWEHRVERVLHGPGFAESWYHRPARQLSGGPRKRHRPS